MKTTLLQVLGLCVSPNFRYSSKCFAEIYRAQYENAMLVHIFCAPIWRPENSVNTCYLLWLSRRVIISTEQAAIYLSTFPNALNSKKAQNHEINIHFSINLIVASCHAPLLNSEIQNALVSKRSTLLSFKIANGYKFTASYADEDKNFRGSLVLDFRK